MIEVRAEFSFSCSYQCDFHKPSSVCPYITSNDITGNDTTDLVSYLDLLLCVWPTFTLPLVFYLEQYTVINDLVLFCKFFWRTSALLLPCCQGQYNGDNRVAKDNIRETTVISTIYMKQIELSTLNNYGLWRVSLSSRAIKKFKI